MFFVSEEFVRQYSSGEEITQTIDEAVPAGTELFEGEYRTKADLNLGARAQDRESGG